MYIFFFFNDTATTEIYTLSLHDALPISLDKVGARSGAPRDGAAPGTSTAGSEPRTRRPSTPRSSASTGAAHALATMMNAAPDSQVTMASATPKKPNCDGFWVNAGGIHSAEATRYTAM